MVAPGLLLGLGREVQDLQDKQPEGLPVPEARPQALIPHTLPTHNTMSSINIFRHRSIESMRQQTLEQTERELHEALLQFEYYAHIVPMLEDRRARLRAALDNKEKAK